MIVSRTGAPPKNLTKEQLNDYLVQYRRVYMKIYTERDQFMGFTKPRMLKELRRMQSGRWVKDDYIDCIVGKRANAGVPADRHRLEDMTIKELDAERVRLAA